jgi:excisionase family DNA binding protein
VPSNPPPLLTVRQVAQRLALDDSTVRRLIQRGKLTGRKLGGCVRVREEDLEAYLEASKITAATPTPTPPRPRVQATAVVDWRSEYERLRR